MPHSTTKTNKTSASSPASGEVAKKKTATPKKPVGVTKKKVVPKKTTTATPKQTRPATTSFMSDDPSQARGADEEEGLVEAAKQLEKNTTTTTTTNNNKDKKKKKDTNTKKTSSGGVGDKKGAKKKEESANLDKKEPKKLHAATRSKGPDHIHIESWLCKLWKKVNKEIWETVEWQAMEEHMHDGEENVTMKHSKIVTMILNDLVEQGLKKTVLCLNELTSSGSKKDGKGKSITLPRVRQCLAFTLNSIQERNQTWDKVSKVLAVHNQREADKLEEREKTKTTSGKSKTQ
jgi:hypothetical protein